MILSGSSSRRLAENIADFNSQSCLPLQVTHFANREMKITLPPQIDAEDICYIVQSTSNPANDHLMELFLAADTLKLEGAKQIQAIIPYFGYARQDKQHLPKECVSIRTIARLLQTVGVEKIITADIHNESVLDKLDLTVENISVLPILAKKVYQSLGLNAETEKDFVIVSPDQGGIIRSQIFAQNFYQNSNNQKLASLKKERQLDRTHYCEMVDLYGDIKNYKLILIDDISTSGGTILKACDLCLSNGATEIYSVIVHADFAQGIAEKIQNSPLIKLFTTNTIEKTVEDLDWYNKIEVLDISQAFRLKKFPS